jgi:hypothetical protein
MNSESGGEVGPAKVEIVARIAVSGSEKENSSPFIRVLCGKASRRVLCEDRFVAWVVVEMDREQATKTRVRRNWRQRKFVGNYCKKQKFGFSRSALPHLAVRID